MCSSEELIHDARQITLEEMIMTNETPMYLVPGRLTIKEKMLVGSLVAHDWDMIMEYTGTPIQPCADVKTVCIALPTLYGNLEHAGCAWVYPVSMRSPYGTDIDLVRRTDMEAQVARVAAEKDEVIAQLSAINSAAEYLLSEEYIGLLERAVTARLATTSNNEDKHRKAAELVIAARAALNEGAAG